MLRFSCSKFEELSREDLYACMQLRQSVFVVEQACAYLDADGLDHLAWHVLAKNDEGKLQAYARIFKKGDFYDEYSALGRICTAKNVRGKGYGKDLLRYCINHCKQIFPTVPIKISAQQYLEEFYNDFGFERMGEEYLEDGIPHIAMVRHES